MQSQTTTCGAQLLLECSRDHHNCPKVPSRRYNACKQWKAENPRCLGKLLACIVRSQCHQCYDVILSLLGFTRSHRALDLANLAAAAGYADQAHLSREARRLAGLTPATILVQLCGSGSMRGSLNP